MKIRSAMLDWQVLSDQDDWPSGAPAQTREKQVVDDGIGSKFRIRLSSRIWLAGIMSVAMVGFAVYLWRTAGAGVAQIETELVEAVAVEQWLQANERTTGAVFDPEVAESWRETAGRDLRLTWLAGDQAVEVEIVDWTIQGDVAAIQAVMTLPETGERYRQTRFYRHMATGWIRTEPQPQLWGPWRTHRTGHLLFRYQQRDERAVKDAAPTVEAIYAMLVSTLGLPESDEPVVVEISLLHGGEGMGSIHPPLTVASLATTLAPLQTASSTLLARGAALTLLEHVRTEILLPDGTRLHEFPLVDALLLWQLRVANVLPAAWHQETVRALYHPAKTNRGKTKNILEDRELCTLGKVWASAQLQLYVSSLCYESYNYPVQQPRASLDGFFLFSPAWQRLLQDFRSGRLLADAESFYDRSQISGSDEIVALTTVVEYAAQEFGSDRLRELYLTIDQYNGWDAMCQDLFDVSASEFEAGWQEYLAETYLANGS